MATNREKFIKSLEKDLGVNIPRPGHRPSKKFDDRSLIRKVAKKLREIYYGEKTYAKKKFPPTGKKK